MWRARCSRILLTLFLLVWTSYAQPARRQTELDVRVNGLLAKMTLEEKVGQLNLFNVDKTNLGQAIASGKVGSVLNALGAAQTNKLQRLAIERSRLQIPLLFGYDVIHGYRTIARAEASDLEIIARLSDGLSSWSWRTHFEELVQRRIALTPVS
jgi:beta-glucosidase